MILSSAWILPDDDLNTLYARARMIASQGAEMSLYSILDKLYAMNPGMKWANKGQREEARRMVEEQYRQTRESIKGEELRREARPTQVRTRPVQPRFEPSTPPLMKLGQ